MCTSIAMAEGTKGVIYGQIGSTNCAAVVGYQATAENLANNVKDIVVDSYATINGQIYTVTEIYPTSLVDVNIETVTLPSTITKVWANAFLNNTSLKSVNLAATQITSLEESTFSGCTKLTTVSFPSNLESINSLAFYNCTKLSSLSIRGTKVKSIDTNAFSSCTSLSTISLPSTLVNIDAFLSCTSLSNVMVLSDKGAMQAQLFSNGNASFNGCTIYQIDTSNSTAKVIAFIGNDNGDDSLGVAASISDTVSDNGINTFIVNEINDWAFFNSNINNITMPSTLLQIDDFAFYNCSSLTSVDLSATNLSSIGMDAFSTCTSLNSVILSNGLISIGDRAFEGCTSLAQITIPESVETIGSDCFGGCTALSACTILNSDASISGDAFQNTADGFVIRVNEYMPIDTAGNAMSGNSNITPVVNYAQSNQIQVIYLKGLQIIPDEIKIGEAFNVAEAFGSHYILKSIVSNNEEVLGVNNANYTMTGNALGSAVLTVTYKAVTDSTDDDDRTITAVVVVYKPVTAFEIDSSFKVVLKNDTATLSVNNAEPFDGYSKYTWTVDNSGIGTILISANNNTICTIYGLSEGEATITCKNVSGVTRSCRVLVVEAVYFDNLKAYDITPSYTNGYNNAIVQFTAQLRDDEGNNVPVSDSAKIAYTSSDTSVIEVAQTGDALLKAPGIATVTAHAQSINGQYDESAVATVIVHSATALSMPSMLTEIDEQAFYGSPAVEVQLGFSVTSIGNGAFAQCKSLKLVVIENGNCTIADNAFSGSTNVTIICPKGSKVATWAETKGIPYVTTP